MSLSMSSPAQSGQRAAPPSAPRTNTSDTLPHSRHLKSYIGIALSPFANRISLRQPASWVNASSGAAWGAHIPRRAGGKQGENPSYFLGPTLGTACVAIAIGHAPADLEPLATLRAFIFVDRHSYPLPVELPRNFPLSSAKPATPCNIFGSLDERIYVRHCHLLPAHLSFPTYLVPPFRYSVAALTRLMLPSPTATWSLSASRPPHPNTRSLAGPGPGPR